jgi:hypothetical protein
MKNKLLNVGGQLRLARMVRLSAVPARKRGDDPLYRAFIRCFACVVCTQGLLIGQCDGWNEYGQRSLTECAHVGRRGLSQKCPDCESLPLCGRLHHRTGKYSHHQLGKLFWGFYSLNRVDLIRQLQTLYRSEGGILK